MRGGTLVTDAELQRFPGERGERRFWALTLACTHIVLRPVTYKPGRPGRRAPRDVADVLPAQKHAYCDQCPTGPAVHDRTVIHVRASPARAAAFVELLRQLDPALTASPPRWRAGGFVDIECESTKDPEGMSWPPPPNPQT